VREKDSLRHCVKRYIIFQAFEERGGIRYIFLSHKDDVADAARYAKTFHATRIIHRADSPAMPDAEWIIDGEDAVQAEPELVFIPVPGHTAGSVSLLYNNRFGLRRSSLVGSGIPADWDHGKAGVG
jgi:glyoxylase-like metal-dependent hydrolase (beta-lactamase superfamily II)